MKDEAVRIEEMRDGTRPWRLWGPYLAERAWGTVREDYSPGGTAWEFFPHDHARSRVYRWNEDGLLGISDETQRLCFALALWNGNDPIIKERLFGLTNSEGNHGEDVKEYYFYLDSTPTHSYMKWLYKYPQAAYPYSQIVRVNRERSRLEPEYELLNTGVFDGDRYFDVFVEYAKESPEEHRNSRFQAVLEQHARPAPALTDFTPVFAALFTGLVALVLVIACANVANLMSARALSRERELVVRAALGATRGRLIRQLLVESVLLAAFAGALGFGLSAWASPLLQQFTPRGEIPLRAFDGPDWRIWVFAAAISLVAGFGAGLLPALRASRVDLNDGLKQGASQTAGGRHRLRNLLVIGQVALSCVVLIASALFLRGLAACRALDLGFRPDRIVMLSLDLGLQGYDQARGLRFEKDVLERVRALPGVESAHFAQHVPFNNNIAIRDTYPEAPTASIPDGHATVAFSVVTPGFVRDFGVRLLRGRDLAPTDEEKSPQVAVINEAMANAFWPGQDPIGQHFRRDWPGAPAIEVVGVTATGKYVMLTEEPRPYYYVPFAQAYTMPATLVVRAAHDPASLAPALRATIRAVDPDLPVYNLITLDDHLATSMFALLPLRMGAVMAGIQGGLGLILAILGLYAVVSYGVARRAREIGVRMALGASRADVLRLVSREGLRLTLTGLGCGLALSLLLSAALSRLVFGVHVFDAVAFPATVAVLLATAGLACWLPARRATRVDPMVALRVE